MLYFLKNLTASHFATLGLLLIAIATQISGLKDWHDATSPTFVAGTLIALGSVLKGINDFKPSQTITQVNQEANQISKDINSGKV